MGGVNAGAFLLHWECHTFDTIMCHSSAFFEQRGLDKLTVDNCIILLCWEHGNFHISTAFFKKNQCCGELHFFFSSEDYLGVLREGKNLSHLSYVQWVLFIGTHFLSPCHKWCNPVLVNPMSWTMYCSEQNGFEGQEEDSLPGQWSDKKLESRENGPEKMFQTRPSLVWSTLKVNINLASLDMLPLPPFIFIRTRGSFVWDVSSSYRSSPDSGFVYLAIVLVAALPLVPRPVPLSSTCTLPDCEAALKLRLSDWDSITVLQMNRQT